MTQKAKPCFRSAFEWAPRKAGQRCCWIVTWHCGDNGEKEAPVPCVSKPSNKLQPHLVTRIFLLGQHTDSKESKENLFKSSGPLFGLHLRLPQILSHFPCSMRYWRFYHQLCSANEYHWYTSKKTTSIHAKIISKHKPPLLGVWWQAMFFSSVSNATFTFFLSSTVQQ